MPYYMFDRGRDTDPDPHSHSKSMKNNILIIAFVLGFILVPGVRWTTGTLIVATGNVVSAVGNVIR